MATNVPGKRRTCGQCRGAIVFALLDRTESGLGGGYMPFDPLANDEGRYAVRATSASSGRARSLKDDETHDHRNEVLAMPHFATCQARTGKGLGDAMENWLKDQTPKEPNHINRGGCPGQNDDPGTRDLECPACAVLEEGDPS